MSLLDDAVISVEEIIAEAKRLSHPLQLWRGFMVVPDGLPGWLCELAYRERKQIEQVLRLTASPEQLATPQLKLPLAKS